MSPAGRPSPKPNREEKKAATKEALLDAATRVFGRQGYVATSVDEVAWEAGMTKGAVYSNFASKDDLFAAVIERHQDRLLLAIPSGVDPSKPASEQATIAGERYMEVLDPEFVLLMLEYTLHAARNPAGHEPMRERTRRIKRAVAAEIERLAADAGFPTVLPLEQLVVAFFAIGEGISLERLIDPTGVPDELYPSMLAIFARGLQATGEDRAAATRKRPQRPSPSTHAKPPAR